MLGNYAFLTYKFLRKVWFNMSKGAVLKVMEIEDKAKKIIDEANAAAKKIVEDATLEAEKSCSELENSLNLEYKERVAQVKEDTLELIEQTIEKTNRDADAMERKAMLNMPVAVRVISRRIVNECQ